MLYNVLHNDEQIAKLACQCQAHTPKRRIQGLQPLVDAQRPDQIIYAERFTKSVKRSLRDF